MHALAYTRQALAQVRPLGRTIVLFGRSRGSVVALNVFVSLTDEERRSVAYVLLEGTFFDSKRVLHTRFPRCGRVFSRLLPWFTAWRDDGHLVYWEKVREVRCARLFHMTRPTAGNAHQPCPHWHHHLQDGRGGGVEL